MHFKILRGSQAFSLVYAMTNFYRFLSPLKFFVCPSLENTPLTWFSLLLLLLSPNTLGVHSSPWDFVCPKQSGYKFCVRMFIHIFLSQYSSCFLSSELFPRLLLLPQKKFLSNSFISFLISCSLSTHSLGFIWNVFLDQNECITTDVHIHTYRNKAWKTQTCLIFVTILIIKVLNFSMQSLQYQHAFSINTIKLGCMCWAWKLN